MATPDNKSNPGAEPEDGMDRLRRVLAESGATEMPDDEDPDEMQVIFLPPKRLPADAK